MGTAPGWNLFYWMFPEVEFFFYVQEDIKNKLFVVRKNNKKLPSISFEE